MGTVSGSAGTDDKSLGAKGNYSAEGRFAFGDNWSQFLECVDEDRIHEAMRSLCEFLDADSLVGRSFLDVGCGSGLFSLAAHRLGARVHSFDYDLASVECTRNMKLRFARDGDTWTIEQGSVLDDKYLARLGSFDVVYAWGVLHHTGAMWAAIDAAAARVAPEGVAFIAIYNDLDGVTRRWAAVKRLYVRSPTALRFLIVLVSAIRLWLPTILRDSLQGDPLKTARERRRVRGMAAWRDVVDWVGGYPYEVAKAEQVIERFEGHGFLLQKLVTRCGIGCNEFVFRRLPPDVRNQLVSLGVLPEQPA